MGQRQAKLGHPAQEQVREDRAGLVLRRVLKIVLLAILEHQHHISQELPVRGVLEGGELVPHTSKVHGLPHHLVVVRGLAGVHSEADRAKGKHSLTLTKTLKLTNIKQYF